MVGIPSEPTPEPSPDRGDRNLYLAVILLGFIATALSVLLARSLETALLWGVPSALLTVFLCLGYRATYGEDTERSRFFTYILMVTFYAIPLTLAVSTAPTVAYVAVLHPGQSPVEVSVLFMFGIAFILLWSLFRLHDLWVRGPQPIGDAEEQDGW